MYPDKTSSSVSSVCTKGSESTKSSKKEVCRTLSKENVASKNTTAIRPLTHTLHEERTTSESTKSEEPVIIRPADEKAGSQPSLGISYFLGEKHVPNEVEELFLKYQKYTDGLDTIT